MTRLIYMSLYMFWLCLCVNISAIAADVSIEDFNDLAKAQFTEEEIIHLQQAKAVVRVWKDKTVNDGAADIIGGIDIEATPEVIWALMIDCERNKIIIPALKKCLVLQESPPGLHPHWDIREQKLRPGVLLPLVSSIFKTTYFKPLSMHIERAGGDMKIQRGRWDLTALESGVTRVSYRARLRPKFPVPGGLLRRGSRKDIPVILQNLRALSEADMKASVDP